MCDTVAGESGFLLSSKQYERTAFLTYIVACQACLSQLQVYTMLLKLSPHCGIADPYQSKGKGKVNSKLQGRRNKRRRIELAVMGASSGAEALEMLEELQEEASEVSFDDAVMLQNVVTVTDPVTEYEEHGGEFLSGSVKVLHALQGGSGSSQFSAVLRRVQPNFIIMYDPTLSCLREASAESKPYNAYAFCHRLKCTKQQDHLPISVSIS